MDSGQYPHDFSNHLQIKHMVESWIRPATTREDQWLFIYISQNSLLMIMHACMQAPQAFWQVRIQYLLSSSRFGSDWNQRWPKLKPHQMIQAQIDREDTEHWSSAIYLRTPHGRNGCMVAPSPHRCLHIFPSKCSKPVHIMDVGEGNISTYLGKTMHFSINLDSTTHVAGNGLASTRI